MSKMLLAVLAVLAGCVSTTTPTPLEGPHEVRVQEQFRVMAGEELVGFLKFVAIAETRFFRVETPAGGWVGNVDRNGRFYKNVPFQPDLHPLGPHSMHKGLGMLFDTAAPIRVLPLVGQGQPTEAAAQTLWKKTLSGTR